MKKTITVMSAKGGVGKTTISVSLINHAAQKGKSVIAVDADVNAPNLSTWFDNIQQWDIKEDVKIFPLPKKYEKCKSIKLICNGKEVPVEYETRGTAFSKKDYKPTFANYKIDFVSGDIIQGKTGSGKVVEQTIKLSNQGDHDLRIIDTAPGTGYPVLASIMNSDYIVIITEPTELGYKDMFKLIGIAKRKPYGVVVNKAYENQKILDKIRSELGDNYLGAIHYDTRILKSLKNHIPPLLDHENQDLLYILELILEKAQEN